MAIRLNTQDLAKVKHLTSEVYPYLHPGVRVYMNEQLTGAVFYWEVTDWLERMQATLDFYEGKVPHGKGGLTRTRRKK